MTDKEKAVVMAYTGIAMLTGDKFDIFHKYVEEIMCRPVFTHEFATCAEEIKEKAKPDFLKLCAEEEPDRPHGVWVYHADWESDGECAYECSRCGMGSDVDYNFCPNCGSKMLDKRQEGE